MLYSCRSAIINHNALANDVTSYVNLTINLGKKWVFLWVLGYIYKKMLYNQFMNYLYYIKYNNIQVEKKYNFRYGFLNGFVLRVKVI